MQIPQMTTSKASMTALQSNMTRYCILPLKFIFFGWGVLTKLRELQNIFFYFVLSKTNEAIYVFSITTKGHYKVTKNVQRRNKDTESSRKVGEKQVANRKF